MLTRQLRMLTHIRLMRGQGMTLAEIEKKLNLNHYAAARAAEQAGKFTVESLEEGYKACIDTDYAIKSGRMRDAAALDYLMLLLSSMK
jgi:DNA polymerase-3 subunit delta